MMINKQEYKKKYLVTGDWSQSRLITALGPEVIKLFSCSIQFSIKFVLQINHVTNISNYLLKT